MNVLTIYKLLFKPCLSLSATFTINTLSQTVWSVKEISEIYCKKLEKTC